MKPRDILSPLCILHVIHSCVGQGILDHVTGDTLNQGMQSQVVSEAVNSAASIVKQTLISQDSVARQAFDAGIDRINTMASAVSEHFGPELETSDTALEIERAGLAFLATANVTASRLAILGRQAQPSSGTHVDLPGAHGNDSPNPVVHRESSGSPRGGGRGSSRGFNPRLQQSNTMPQSAPMSFGSHFAYHGAHGNNSPNPVVHRESSGSPRGGGRGSRRGFNRRLQQSNTMPQSAPTRFGSHVDRLLHRVAIRLALARAPLPATIICPYARSRWPMPSCRGPTVDKYRTYDGSCNNKNNRLWGRANTPFERFIGPHYGDGVNTPRDLSFNGGDLPLPRKISTDFHTDLTRLDLDLNHLAMEFGQFVSHDIQFNALSKGFNGSNLDCCAQKDRPNCFPITIPADDPHFPTGRDCMNMVRSIPTPNLECTLGVRQQLNQNTHYLDGSAIYGSDKKTADSLRTFTGGIMKTDFSDNLPPNNPPTAGCIRTNQNHPCFMAGDRRVNQQPGLMAMQTIWLREHNRVAVGLNEVNVEGIQTDEELYQEARKIVIAELQYVTYNEYLPIILGEQTMTKYGLKPRRSGFYTGYSSTEKGIIRNGFMTAAYRFGHSMVYHKMPTYNYAHSRTTNNDLKDIFLKSDLMYTHGVDQITRGLMKTPSENVDQYLTPQITRHLFERRPGFGGDLAAININRGRDHGLPAYYKWREYCRLQGEYSHSPEVKAALQATYGHYKDIDLFTGGVSETPVQGGKVGPTFACLIGKQFRSLKKGDRFFYENGGGGEEGFSHYQLDEIKRQTLSKIICRNTRISSLQKQALKIIDAPGNPMVFCRNIEDMDLSPWGNGLTGGCIPRDGAWSNWQYTSCLSNNIRIRYRLCNNPIPNECGRPCFQYFDITVEFCWHWNWWDQPWWERPDIRAMDTSDRRISMLPGRSSSRMSEPFGGSSYGRMSEPFGGSSSGRMSEPFGGSSSGRISESFGGSSSGRMLEPGGRYSSGRMSEPFGGSSSGRRSASVGRSSSRMSGPFGGSSTRRRMLGSDGRSSSRQRISRPGGRSSSGRMSGPVGRSSSGRISGPFGGSSSGRISEPFGESSSGRRMSGSVVRSSSRQMISRPGGRSSSGRLPELFSGSSPGRMSGAFGGSSSGGISGFVGRSSSQRMSEPFGGSSSGMMSASIGRSSTGRMSGPFGGSSSRRMSEPFAGFGGSSSRRMSGTVGRSLSRQRSSRYAGRSSSGSMSRPFGGSSSRMDQGMSIPPTLVDLPGQHGDNSPNTVVHRSAANTISAPASDSAQTNDIMSQITAALSGQTTIDATTIERVASSIRTESGSASTSRLRSSVRPTRSNVPMSSPVQPPLTPEQTVPDQTAQDIPFTLFK